MANQGRGGAGDPGRRPTKAEKKDQARHDREQIHQRMAGRKRQRTIGIVLAVAAVVVAVVAFLVLPKDSTPTTTAATSPSDLLAQAADAAKTAGCDAVTNVGFYGGVSDLNAADYYDQAHVGANNTFTTMPALSTYPSIPPASGPHNPSPLPAGVYDSPPDLSQAIHSLEHGGSIVWYSPSTPADVVDEIAAFYSKPTSAVAAGQDRVIVAPYDYPDQGAEGSLPQGVQMALVSWHDVQTCAQPSLPVALDFTSQYSTPLQGGAPILGRTYLGEAPEPGAQM